MKPIDAHEIVPYLWQGGEPPIGNHLKRAGFQAVVLCAQELQFPAWYFQGIEVIHAPNDDSEYLPLTPKKLAIAIKAARRVAELVLAEQKCLVTCKAGLNRSGLVTATALHRMFGWSGQQCIDLVREKRHAKKYPHLYPICNEEFEACLLKLPVRVLGRRKAS